MRTLSACSAGFLLAVLWFDLMFDVQVRGTTAGDVPQRILDSISVYYARVTTSARPMNRLVALAMLVTLGSVSGLIVNEELARWRSVAALVCVVGAIGLAAARTVKNAVRLGGGKDDHRAQSQLAQLILRDHIVCFGLIFVVILLIALPA